MNFCKECNNKLYPLEEEEKLFQSCKDCGFKETYEGNIIEKKIFKNKNISILNNNNFIIYDDSLPRTVQKQCPNKNCNSNKDESRESVFMQDPISLKLTYVCTKCKVEWKYS